MRIGLLLVFVATCLLCQTSCGLAGFHANRVKHALQWPFRAELEPRHLEVPEGLVREEPRRILGS